MANTTGIALAAASVAVALIGGSALGAGTPAAAASTQTAPMQISATGGDHTEIDRDGTQGDFTDAVQGAVDSDGDQDAFDMTRSEEAAPQVTAPHRMTK